MKMMKFVIFKGYLIKYQYSGTHLPKLKRKVIYKIIFLLNKLVEVHMVLFVKSK
jgi:hypothetical protein